MRSVELHLHVSAVARSAGRSAVAAAAYRSASRLLDERTGQVHDYTRKRGVEHHEVFAPLNAPAWAGEREALWNAAEAKENRSNSRTALEIEFGFLAEFSHAQRVEVARRFAAHIQADTGAAVDIALHRPHRDGDERNFHAHVLFTTRAFNPRTKDGWEKNKARSGILAGYGNEESQDTLRRYRETLAEIQNDVAKRENLPARVEHLSFKERGITKEAEQHRGPKATEIEREGKKSEIGKANERRDDDARAMAAQIAEIEAELKIIDLALERTKRQRQQESERKAESSAFHAFEQDTLAAFDEQTDKGRASLRADLARQTRDEDAKLAQDIKGLERALHTQGAFMNFWRTVTGRNARDRAKLDGLRAQAEAMATYKRRVEADYITRRDLERQAVQDLMRKRQQDHDLDHAARTAAAKATQEQFAQATGRDQTEAAQRPAPEQNALPEGPKKKQERGIER